MCILIELHSYCYIVYHKNANKQYIEGLFAPSHGSASPSLQGSWNERASGPRRDSEAPRRGAYTTPCQPDKEAAIPPHQTWRRPRMLWQALGVMPGFWGGGGVMRGWALRGTHKRPARSQVRCVSLTLILSLGQSFICLSSSIRQVLYSSNSWVIHGGKWGSTRPWGLLEGEPVGVEVKKIFSIIGWSLR
jgi:hypothetical protein